MPKATPPSPRRYGTCSMCGAVGCDAPVQLEDRPVLAAPSAATIVDHFRDHHRPVTQVFLDGHTPVELLAFHQAEHARRSVPSKEELVHGGHLRHEHLEPAVKSKSKGRAA